MPVSPIRICQLTSVHPPYDTRIFHKECRALVEAGYAVTLVAPTTESKEVDGICIRGITPATTRFGRMIATNCRALAGAWKSRAEIVHFHDPELLPFGLLLRLAGKHVIYDAHEDVPRDILVKDWIWRPLRLPLSLAAAAIEWVAGQALSAIVGATKGIAARFPSHKTVALENFPDLSEFPAAGAPGATPHTAAFAYVGSIADIRGATTMVKAMHRLPEAGGAKLILAGSFSPPELEKTLRALPGWWRVDYRGWAHRSDVARILQSSIAGLVVLEPLPTYLDSQPLKLFEYMAAGLPVIASDFPAWRSIIEEARCGLLVDPLDPDAIAGAMQWMMENRAEAAAMGRRGRIAVEEKFNWALEKRKLIALYSRLLA